MKNRPLVSIILFVFFLLLPVSAKLIDNSNPDISNFARHFHGLVGLIFTVVAIFHIIYNWKALKSYLKKKN